MKKHAFILFIMLSFFTIHQAVAQKKQFTYTVEINNTPENVWNALMDYSSFKLWDNNIVDVRCPEELKKRQSCQVISESGQIYDVEIFEIVENESYTLRYDLPTGTLYMQRELSLKTPLELTETVWYRGISQKTFERYKGENYEESIKQKLEGFKNYMEDQRGNGK
ncbi:hypothetical protein ACOKFD_17105 [Flagellimonas sp. S174]|uniref:hypothetical protein n=1 Tax=Flagellimonas sp. S174 TaxID=3410790 RepID=UPI003BF5AAB8